MRELPSISIVIPCYQGARTIGAAVDSLLAQSYEGQREILVVRTGSDDGTDEMVRSRPGVKLIARAERAFACRARNIGAAKASGEIVAFIDADCVAMPGWLFAAAKASELGVRAQGGAIETRAPKTVSAWAEEFLETLEFHPRGKARPLAFASAANSSYDAELFRSVGGFPEVKLGEDLLLGEALREKGVPIAFNPEMCVQHENAVAISRFLEKQREHGVYSAVVRRTASMRGSLFVRSPWLLPLVGPARLVRLLLRTVDVSPSLLPALAALSPLLLLGVASWTWGFARGVIGNGK